MKKLLMLSITITVLLIVGCSEKKHQLSEEGLNSYIEQLEVKLEAKTSVENDLEQKIIQLEAKVKQCELEVDKMKEEKLILDLLNIPSLQFVRAHTQGDVETVRSLVSKDVKIIEKDSGIYSVYKMDNGQEIEIPLGVHKDGNFKDMVIIGHGYNDQRDAYVIYIREFYVDDSGEYMTPPTYLDLYFRKYGYNWKVVGFQFDV